MCSISYQVGWVAQHHLLSWYLSCHMCPYLNPWYVHSSHPSVYPPITIGGYHNFGRTFVLLGLWENGSWAMLKPINSRVHVPIYPKLEGSMFMYESNVWQPTWIKVANLMLEAVEEGGIRPKSSTHKLFPRRKSSSSSLLRMLNTNELFYLVFYFSPTLTWLVLLTQLTFLAWFFGVLTT